MNTALAVADVTQVTPEQLDLVKKTVAVGATADELKLYLYDCARQGVHPLDKLIHFTKRGGKYTPITSIDFMRIRASETGEYAGSDDAEFAGEQTPTVATVTVWRLVQGQRCSFTASARWAEYKPESNDFMWKKMPHVMLAKCAEALALRKGFPKQLAGLYAKEEMDQASPSVVVTEPAPVSPPIRTRIKHVEQETKKGKKSGEPYTKTTVILESGVEVVTLDNQLAQTAKDCMEAERLVDITTRDSRFGVDIVTISKVPTEAEADDLAM